MKPPESLQWAHLFPFAHLHQLDPSKTHSIQSLGSWTSATAPRHMVYDASSTPSLGPQDYPASHPFQPVSRPGSSCDHRMADVSMRSFSKSMEGSSFLSPSTRLSPGPLTGVLISGSGPPIPALPGTELSPAPSQSPSDRSPLLPLLAGCSWYHRCAGLGRRRGSGSAPAPVARWPRTAARDREGKMRQGHIGSKV